MKTITEFVVLSRLKYEDSIEFIYLFPTLYVVITDELFAELTGEQRDLIFSRKLEMSLPELNSIRALGALEVLLVTRSERISEYSFLDSAGGGHHWLEWFNPLRWDNANQTLFPNLPANSNLENQSVRSIHFYGYKGGQGRSTVLALVAKFLADAGNRVLLVDADIEAPSLDSMFGVSAELPEQTLMGLCGWAVEIDPLSRAYVGQQSDGFVDLVACCPRTSDFDMDFAAFAASTALDTRMLEKAILRLRKYVEGDAQKKYDVVLFDHRTGITSSVLPIVSGWPGSVTLFVRPDGTTRMNEVSRVLNTLLAQDGSSSNAFISFSLDPKETTASAREKNGRFVDQLLSLLSDSITRVTGGEPIDPLELEQSWIFWNHDTALLSSSIPNIKDLASANQDAISQLANVLGLNELKPNTLVRSTPKLTKSGASDEGWFILTPDIARLFSPTSSILYVLGRKGTGKTRLVRELQSKNLGEPLLAAADFEHGGLPSGSTAFQTLLAACGGRLEVFWWSLLRLALECGSTSGTNLIDHILKKCDEQPPLDFATYGSPAEVQKEIKNSQHKRVFLIDGIETAVPASLLREFVEIVFRFISSIQYNRHISSHLTIKLFIRSDLARAAGQNVEQQIENNEINLRWDKSAILNFALGRLASLDWFTTNFNQVCSDIEERKELIARGALADDEAEELLLEVFPKSLERNKLKTTTFFSTYFSDAGGDDEGRASFYPRLFDGFLRDIDAKASNSTPDNALDKNGRLKSTFVLKAYDDASAKFMDDVRTELYTLLYFDDEANKNNQLVDSLIDAFVGQKTPFVLEELVEILTERASLPKESIRQALRAMKSMGIFEDRPGFPGAWRTGRLYKSGLRMKYVRG